MSIFSSSATLATIFLFLTLVPAQAQSHVHDGNAYAAIGPYTASYSTPDVPVAPKKTLLAGKITNAAGALAGAVVILTATKQMAVTNANGEFELEVPANSGPLQGRVTYAGYADENIVLNPGEAASTVNLANATIITVARHQRLKAYLKTAHKQVRHDLRKIHAK